MSRAPTWLGIAFLGGAAGCATTHPEALTSAADADRTINTLRAQNNSYVRQIEELQNRVFILEDRLDSLRVSEQQRVTPSLPVVKALRADSTPLPPAYDPMPPMPASVDPPPSELAAADAPVEYAGEAARPEHGRPVLRNAHADMPASEPAAPRAPATLAHAAPVPKAPVPVVVHAVPASKAAAPAPVVVRSTPAPKSPAPVAVHAAPAPKVLAPAPAAPATKPAPVVLASPPKRTAPVVVAAAFVPAPAPAVPPTTLARDGTEWCEPVAAEPLRIYRDALEALRAGHHAAALAGFRRFLDRYPVHDYADNAQYWIGECYYDLRQYQAATREFRAVIERYPRGNKVPDAMLKLGFSHLALGQTADGRQVLDSLVHAFPKHEAATLATARLTEPPFGAKTNVSLGTIAPRRAGTQ
ncbi:MAG TPA: tol-pal system protein YbgF [Polyangia bacterium]|jgi:tol-pal system protein YbgF